MHDADFIPARRLDGGHRMTLYTWGRPRHFPGLSSPVARYFDVAPDTRVLAECHWQPTPRRAPTLLVLHGLEASSRAHYMLGIADKGGAVGFNVVLLNQRNCGDTEHLSHGLYHSGLSDDPAAVIRELIELDGLPSISVIGYSLGGNVALRLGGAYGADHPSELRSISAVSPTMDLARCVRALERSQNAIYEWNFVRNLKRRMQRKARVLPGRFDLSSLADVRTVRGFDEAFTAPHHGFRDADDYYHRASSLRLIDRVRVPVLILSAEDDPFVPADQFRHAAIHANAMVTTRITRFGGHCGFFAEPSPGFDGYWAERTTIDFATRHAALTPRAAPGYERRAPALSPALRA